MAVDKDFLDQWIGQQTADGNGVLALNSLLRVMQIFFGVPTSVAINGLHLHLSPDAMVLLTDH